jgi:aldose 1-epimerase
MGIRKDPFGKTIDGKVVDLCTLTNVRGMEVKITNYGATLVSLKVPDRHNVPVDVVLGYDSLTSYERDTAYFGGIVGRYANRIAGGEFTLHGKRYHLALAVLIKLAGK